MKIAFKKPYIFLFLLIFIGYIILDVFVSGFNKTLPLILNSIGTVDWSKLGISLFLTLIIAFLVALNTTIFTIKYRERRGMQKAGLLAGVGAVGGLATGVCSACVAGLFPLIFGVFGVTFTWAFLPFDGLEIQILVIGLLGASYYMLTKRNI